MKPIHHKNIGTITTVQSSNDDWSKGREMTKKELIEMSIERHNNVEYAQKDMVWILDKLADLEPTLSEVKEYCKGQKSCNTCKLDMDETATTIKCVVIGDMDSGEINTPGDFDIEAISKAIKEGK